MICPSCNKNMTSVVKDVFIKKINSIKRDRYCRCGFLFSTFEKFEKSSNIKKQRPATLWKNDRMLWYGISRYESYNKTLKKIFQKLNIKRKVIFKDKFITYFTYDSNFKTSKFSNKIKFLDWKNKNINKLPQYHEHISNFKGKSWLEVKVENKKKIKAKIDDKKQTILNIIRNPDYWLLREYYFPKKDSDERLNKDIFRKEVQEFYKSVCSYVTDPKYNQDFFIKFNPEAEYWKEKETWEIYLKIR